MSEPEPKPIFDPIKIMRIGSMISQILEGMNKDHPLDNEALVTLRTVYQNAVDELEGTVPADLGEELDRLTKPFEDDSELTESELRLAQSQLLGWLEGLVQGLNLMMQAHQMQQSDLAKDSKNLPGKGSGQYL